MRISSDTLFIRLEFTNVSTVYTYRRPIVVRLFFSGRTPHNGVYNVEAQTRRAEKPRVFYASRCSERSERSEVSVRRWRFVLINFFKIIHHLRIFLDV